MFVFSRAQSLALSLYALPVRPDLRSDLRSDLRLDLRSALRRVLRLCAQP